MKKLLFVPVAVVIAAVSLVGQGKILTTAEAKTHIGETATVCGTVVGTRYLSTPCFLLLPSEDCGA